MNSLSKFAYYQQELQDFRAGKQPALRRIQLDPIAGCNHDCPFCIYRYNRSSDDPDMNALFNESRIIGIDKLTEIFDDCLSLGVKAVELTGGGEPTLHPYFPQILYELNERNLEIGLVTNGAWRMNHTGAILHELRKATWVRFSLDAATPITHMKTHASRECDFKNILWVIEKLVSLNTVDVGISFIVQKDNYHEIEDAVELAEDLGVKYIRFGGVVFEGERVDHIELTGDQHEEVSRRICVLTEQSKVPIINSFDTRSLVDFERYAPGDTCYYSHLATVIGADTKLYTCCVWKYRPAGMIADLKDQRLADVWFSGALEKFYEKFDISEKCNRCFLKDKNDQLHQFVTAEHINFV